MKQVLIMLALLGFAAQASAINMSGFRDAPITRLDAEELKAFRAAVMKTLDESPDGTTVEWKAAKTKFVSKITPQKSFADGKLKCREATIESEAQNRFQRGVYSFCKAANGDWQFRSPPARSK